jgi:hypothetical protein
MSQQYIAYELCKNSKPGRRILKVVFRTTLAWLGASVLLAHSPTVARAQRTVDSSFAGVIARLSEGGGYFDSDNIISNEASYSDCQPAHEGGVRGGVYIGVGPDQNFSYIALIRPRVAFMLDVRRDNMLEHLLFKSIFVVAQPVRVLCCACLARRSRRTSTRGQGDPRPKFSLHSPTRDSIHKV